MSIPLDNLEKMVELASAIMSSMEECAFQDERFAELSMRQILYLNTILRLGHPTFSDLARELNVSKPSVTSNVTMLIKKGYVQKVQDHEDLRSFHIMPTQKAREFNQLHQNIHKILAKQLAGNLNEDEISQLVVLMQKSLFIYWNIIF